MGIRKARPDDLPVIKELLRQLGYPDTGPFLANRILQLLDHPDAELLVYEHGETVAAVMSIHFIPQIALQGDFARISYFAVDEKFRSQGIGRKMEQYCTRLARKRNCDRIEIHSHSLREAAHRFYFRQGYIEWPKYLIKPLQNPDV
ncbi:GNAT family N-acetyltransferase (plasmid) [Pedobacter sp. BS3]|uniref:GNAT family N-acetyltransferase n=1 Tax=Pedobacter sp. BS3 TaxID=2567937 RepID=UPI0011ED2F6B|nr:GNAT family N-acetyltransferase [Pedobacter sp. BS3]TZF86368.1 GNAT family N-acetyltransferase [Pedobacter sp. BS3]